MEREEHLTAEQFAQAVSTAVRAVLDVYAEIDTVLRTIDAKMKEEGYQAWHVIPGSRKGAEHNRVLREWKGRFYVRAVDGAEQDEEADEEAEDGEEERSRGPREIPPMTPIAFVYARVYRAHDASFAPCLRYGVLEKARLAKEQPPTNQPLYVKRSHMRRVLAAVDARADRTWERVLRTTASIILAKGGKRAPASERSLVFDAAEPKRVELHEIESLDRARQIAADLQQMLSSSTAQP